MVAEENVPKDPKVDKDTLDAEEAEVAVDQTTSHETPKSERPSAINTGHLTNPSETEPDGKEYEATNTLSTESDKDHSVGINLIMSSPKNCLLNAWFLPPTIVTKVAWFSAKLWMNGIYLLKMG